MEIGEAVVAAFNRLPKTGKPTTTVGSGGRVRAEWTVLAGIVMLKPATPHRIGSASCVALGCGVKCSSFRNLSSQGDCLHDMHAEVVCRRAFIRFLMDHIEKAFQSESEVFVFRPEPEGPLFALRSGIEFHMYVSQTPCGDASMEQSLSAQTEEEREKNESKKRQYQEHGCGRQKLPKLTNSTERESTLPPALADALTRGTLIRGRLNPETTGCLRTKPGRIDSEISLSLSCSDKIARWCALGVGGALLSHFCDPIYLLSLTIGEAFFPNSMERAINARISELKELPPPFRVQALKFRQSETTFLYTKSARVVSDPLCTVVPSNNVICAWTSGNDLVSEVLTNGRKLGSSPRKGIWPDKSRSMICKRSIGQKFMAVVQLLDSKGFSPMRTRWMESYKAAKVSSLQYRSARAALLASPSFRAWVTSSHEHEDFPLP
ncbi:adenosine deaminase/editase [Zopfochytrium polystomum]|nr:adenosine deaminase/editase [Zopfochytrium polystomum]